MEDGERTKISCGRFLLLLSQGVIMGIGAVRHIRNIPANDGNLGPP